MLELKPGPGSVPIAEPPHTEHAYATNGLRNTAAATPDARTPHRLITDPHSSNNMRIGARKSPYRSPRAQLRYTSVKRTGQRPTTKYQYIPHSVRPTCRFAENR
jgi:hypothetical protein